MITAFTGSPNIQHPLCKLSSVTFAFMEQNDMYVYKWYCTVTSLNFMSEEKITSSTIYDDETLPQN